MQNILKYILIASFLFIVVFILISNSNKVNNIENTRELNYANYTSRIKIKDTSVNVEIVKTAEAQARGLSGRENLQEDEGMLFDFEKPDVYYFWMKDMKFPIDIIWFDENRKIIYIEKNITPESYPQSFGPDQNAKYVLEVVSGFTEKYNIKIGDEIVFQLPD